MVASELTKNSFRGKIIRSSTLRELHSRPSASLVCKQDLPELPLNSNPIVSGRAAGPLRAPTMLLPGEINPLLMVFGPDDAPEPRPEHDDPVAGRKGRLDGPILIVEDDADIRDTLAEILEYEGFDVVPAASGQEALERLRTGLQPGLILLDLMMPGIDGWGMAGRFRQMPKLSGVPVLVLSGVHDIEQQAASLRVEGCLTKPVEVERLLELIHRFCH